MENLKKWIFDKISFDRHDDKDGDQFTEILSDTIDTLTIYEDDAKEFFSINPLTVLKLAASFAGRNNSIEFTQDTNFSDIVAPALDALCFEWYYSELKALYLSEFDEDLQQ